MMFNEELLSDERFAPLSNTQQSEIISKHCAEVEKYIRTASSRLEAERISANTCLQFQHECSSDLVRNALTRRVEELITKHWKNRT
jgi:hypothetical protein